MERKRTSSRTITLSALGRRETIVVPGNFPPGARGELLALSEHHTHRAGQWANAAECARDHAAKMAYIARGKVAAGDGRRYALLAEEMRRA